LLCTKAIATAPGRLLNEKFAEVAPVALATTLYGPPTVAFAVNVAEVATPLAFVVAVFTPPANVPLAPLVGAVNVTNTPLTGLFPASVTVATKGAANAVAIAVLCPDPLVTTTFAAGPAVLLNEKFAEVAPVALATTLYGPPTVAFAVNVAEVATPLAFVVAVFTPPANVPLAPLVGAVNVTNTPLTGLFPASVTVATKAAANAELTVAFCPDPLVTTTLAAGPTRFVSEKFAGVATPATAPVTLYGPPAVAFAVNVAEVATPLAFVVAVFTPPAKVPLAPLVGAVNVTSTPLTGLFPASVTVATKGATNAVLIAVLCPDPLVTTTLAGGAVRFVNEKFAEVAPVALATTLYGPPTVAFAVNVAEVATPLAFVVAVFTPPANVPLAPLVGAVNVTNTPLTGLFPASVTVATKGAANAVLIAVLCPDPLVTTTLAAGPTVFVSEKLAEVEPVALATTLYGPPAVAFAVNVAEVATPLAFVVAVFTPPANVPLAPLVGAVNVTNTPLTGLFPASVTVATKGAANAVLIAVLCPDPLVATTLAAGPTLFVSAKLAGVATPETEAATL
jgi:hypothetical protein